VGGTKGCLPAGVLGIGCARKPELWRAAEVVERAKPGRPEVMFFSSRNPHPLRSPEEINSAVLELRAIQTRHRNC
jgi:hypothetical protein